MIPRHRAFEEAVPAAPKEMVERNVVCITVRFDSGGIDEILVPSDGDAYEFVGTDLLMRVRGVRYTVNLTKACYWSSEEKTVLVEKAPFKPGGTA